MKNKFLAVLLSAAVAFGLWLYVITVVNPESEKIYYDIPVVLQNKEILAERGLMIVSEPPKVTLALKSDRITLNDLNENNINVIANVANIENPGTHNLTYGISYPGNIPDNAVSVQNSSTDLITLKVENKLRKTVPIVVLPVKNEDGTDSAVPTGYITDLKNAQLTIMKDKEAVVVTEVELTGPESVVSQIHQAVIQVDLNGKNKTFAQEYQYALCNKDGEPVDAEMVTTNVEKVNLTLKIQRVKEVTLEVDKLFGGGATPDNTTVTITPAKIGVAGGDALLEKVADILTVGTVDLSALLEDTTLKFSISKFLPEGVENLTGVDEITVEVKFIDLAVRTMDVTVIETVNVPESFEIDMLTQVLQVTVRGPQNKIDSLKAEDLIAEVDFLGAQVGTSNMEVVISFGPDFMDVGAVGTYSVSVIVSEPVEPSIPAA